MSERAGGDRDLEPFFVLDGEHATATASTRGPWSHEHQHGGPPSALLARAIERAEGVPEGARLARLTVEIFRPVPIARLRVEVEVIRPGKRAQTAVARLLDQRGRELMRAVGLTLRGASPIMVPDGNEGPEPPPLPSPEASPPWRIPFSQGEVGYHTAMEIRLARGTFGSGALSVWMRMRPPLVEGEEPSPAQRAIIAADSGNGVSAALDPFRFSFVNPDLTVVLARAPEGPWIGLDASTRLDPSGTGLARSRLLDQRGTAGFGLQNLIVEAR